MKLLDSITKTLAYQFRIAASKNPLPDLYSGEKQGLDAIAKIKFFIPGSNFTFYASEYSQEEKLFFGLVVLHEIELGYMSYNELEELKTPRGFTVEIDRHFAPMALKDCKKIEKCIRGEK